MFMRWTPSCRLIWVKGISERFSLILPKLTFFLFYWRSLLNINLEAPPIKDSEYQTSRLFRKNTKNWIPPTGFLLQSLPQLPPPDPLFFSFRQETSSCLCHLTPPFEISLSTVSPYLPWGPRRFPIVVVRNQKVGYVHFLSFSPLIMYREPKESWRLFSLNTSLWISYPKIFYECIGSPCEWLA